MAFHKPLFSLYFFQDFAKLNVDTGASTVTSRDSDMMNSFSSKLFLKVC